MINDEKLRFSFCIDILQTVPTVKVLLEESNLWNLREGKMPKELITMPEIKLVGICVRTGA